MITRDPLDATIRAFLDDEAEAMPRRARSADDMALAMAPRVRRRSLVPWFLQPAAFQWPRAFRLAWALAVILLLLLVGAAILWAGSNLLRTPPRIVQIAVDLPLGQPQAGAQAILNAIRLAVADSDGLAGAFAVEIPDSAVLDDTVAGGPDQEKASANVLQILREPRNVALIGPFHSGLATIQIPLTNDAGLLQCSPANTASFLTRGPEAAGLRPRPDRPSYVRVVGTDDDALRRTAGYTYDELAVRSVYVIDGDVPALGDAFVQAFVARGGTLAGRVALPDAFNEGNAIGLTAAAAATDPGAIVFTGQALHAAWLIKEAARAGLVDVWFVGRDSLLEGGPGSPGFVELSEGAAERAVSAFPASLDGPDFGGFVARYRAEYGDAPTFYAAAGYACAQVVLAAIARIDDPGMDFAAIREAVRAAGTDTEARFDTVLGTIAFDAAGDVSPDRTTILGYDAASGGWAVRSVEGD